ncbi:MAG: hypothetical protein O7H41_04660 [Planctomycetota bacterium]|nr:hypothetical protein [Planctomycetota bacterium]
MEIQLAVNKSALGGMRGFVMSSDFVTREEVLKVLQIDENELKQLISDGDIKAEPSSETVRFSLEEVLEFKRGREINPTARLDAIDRFSPGEDKGGE